MNYNKNMCSIIVAVLGNYFKIELDLYKTLSSLNNLPMGIEVIICCDGPFWKTTPLIQSIMYNVNFTVLEVSKQTDCMGILFNEGLHQSSGEYCTFIWPGVILDPDMLLKHCDLLNRREEVSCIYTNTFNCEEYLQGSINYGWLQCQNMIDLNGSIFRKSKLIELDGFDTNAIFQRYPGWDIFLRLSKYNRILYVTEKFTTKKWTAETYPFIKYFPYPKDLIHRSLVGSRDPNKYIIREPIRVTVTGGYWEPTHNQLCFFNYFESDEGKKIFTWKSLFDFKVTENDLIGSDIVIISRGRHGNILNVLDICEKKDIPTLYMIDDNWFTVGDDWPVYKSIFSPGKPDYETFLECLKRCTAVLVYSPIMENYINKYAKKTLRLDININLKDFNANNNRNNRKNILGYVGSPRYSDAAFEGMLKFIKKYNNSWDMLIFGNIIPEKLSGLKDLIYIQYTNYHNYAQTISQIHPDILIAPLDDCPSSRSKCFNKFLEITACGAVGIYTNITPYSLVVKNQITGLLVPIDQNNNSDYWSEMITDLALDKDKRSFLFSNASELVKNYFETDKRYNDFYQMILPLLKNKSVEI